MTIVIVIMILIYDNARLANPQIEIWRCFGDNDDNYDGVNEDEKAMEQRT